MAAEPLVSQVPVSQVPVSQVPARRGSAELARQMRPRAAVMVATGFRLGPASARSAPPDSAAGADFAGLDIAVAPDTVRDIGPGAVAAETVHLAHQPVAAAADHRQIGPHPAQPRA